MTNRRRTCLVCGTPLTQPVTGRPRRFDREGCRRVADREVKRLDTRLEGLDWERDVVLRQLAEWAATGPPGTGSVATANARLGAIDEAIREATERMVELLDDAPLDAA
jgi:hypothetical protein